MSTHDNEKNAILKPDVLAALAEQAKTEGKTPDDLANELLDAVLKLREQAKADQQWQELQSYGRGQAKSLGIRESDVPPRQRVACRTARAVSAPDHRRF